MSEEKTPAVSPLRWRMIEEMTARRLCEKTQTSHIRAVRRLAKFLGRSPDSVNSDDLRRFQVHLVQVGLSPMSINSTIYGVRFFLENTLDRPDLVRKLRPVRVEQRLPVILSREEVTRLIDAAPGIKYQTALSVAYGAGLRAGEVIGLKSTDVDSQRMVLRVEQGKGQKDRYAMLPPVLLERLRAWWRYAKPLGMVRDGGWLFPGRNPINPIGLRMLNRAVHEAARAAGIDKRVSMHTLRHYVAFRTMSPDLRGLCENASRRLAAESSIRRYSPQVLQAAQEAQQPIAWAITPPRTVRRRGLRQRLLLHRERRLQIDLGCLHRFVAKPQRDDGTVHTGLQKFEGHGVPKQMDGDPLRLQRRARSGRRRGVLLQHVLDAMNGEPLALGTGK